MLCEKSTPVPFLHTKRCNIQFQNKTKKSLEKILRTEVSVFKSRSIRYDLNQFVVHEKILVPS